MLCHHTCVLPCVYLAQKFSNFKDKPCRAGHEHEKAAGGGPEDKAQVPTGDGEKLPWTGGGPGEEGTQLTADTIIVLYS